MTEKEYRALDINSYSSIKVFLEDRKKYYRKFVLKEVIKEEESDELIFGSLVDCLLFTPEEYDNRYVLSLSQVPGGQYGKFVSTLWEVTKSSMNSEGEVTLPLEGMMLDAYNKVKFDKDGNIVDFKRDDFEIVKRKFLGTDLEGHYRQLRESYGKTVIELSTLEKSQAVIQELRSNNVTKEIINLVTSERFTVYNQFAIVGDFNGFPLKCLIDKLVIDHIKKIIYIYDLKTAWDNEYQFQYNYFKYKYYLQAAVYFYLVKQWANGLMKLRDYSVMYPRFIVAESSNYKNPLIYTTNSTNLIEGMEGFAIDGREYPGLEKAINNLLWHEEMGLWNISKDNYENRGIVAIRPFDNTKSEK
jgi:hypothetical protein